MLSENLANSKELRLTVVRRWYYEWRKGHKLPFYWERSQLEVFLHVERLGKLRKARE